MTGPRFVSQCCVSWGSEEQSSCDWCFCPLFSRLAKAACSLCPHLAHWFKEQTLVWMTDWVQSFICWWRIQCFHCLLPCIWKGEVIRAFLLLKTTSGGPCTCFACGDIIRDEPRLFLLSLLFASFGYPTTSLKLNMDSCELCSLGNPYRSHYLYVLSIFVWWCYIVATL